MDGQIARCAPPTTAHDQGDDDQRTSTQAKRFDVRLQVGDLILEAAHRMLLRVVQKPERTMSV